MAVTDPRRDAFVDDMGAVLAGLGLPSMAGRILAALLVASPPEQSAAQLAERLQASRGSISTMTRLLEAPGLIQRVRKPGDRRVYYRTTPDGWFAAMRRQADQVRSLRSLAERGAALMADEPPQARRGIEETVDYLRFWEDELARVVERWAATHERAQGSR
jgi:DNA-binding transcriptional regulator GbsR (MarR family)